MQQLTYTKMTHSNGPKSHTHTKTDESKMNRYYTNTCLGARKVMLPKNWELQLSVKNVISLYHLLTAIV